MTFSNCSLQTASLSQPICSLSSIWEVMSYHATCGCSNGGRSVHDMAELKRFLALVVLMGLINFPSIEDRWVTSWPFVTFAFSSVMSRDRFSLLLRFLHLNDSTKYIPKGEPGYDPLYKLRPFVDSLIANFKAAFNLGHEIAVDEGMIGFKSRLWFLQYMPKKKQPSGGLRHLYC